MISACTTPHVLCLLPLTVVLCGVSITLILMLAHVMLMILVPLVPPMVVAFSVYVAFRCFVEGRSVPFDTLVDTAWVESGLINFPWLMLVNVGRAVKLASPEIFAHISAATRVDGMETGQTLVSWAKCIDTDLHSVAQSLALTGEFAKLTGGLLNAKTCVLKLPQL